MAAAKNIKIILGNDEGKVQEAREAHLATLAPRLDADFGMEVVEGRVDNIEGAVEAINRVLQGLQTPPFFGEKLVHLKNTNLFSSVQTAGFEEVVDAISNLLDELESGLPDNINFLITGDKLEKVKRNNKRLMKVAKPIECNKVEVKGGWEKEVRPYIRKRADQIGAVFTPEALDLFAQLIGTETKIIDNEIQKMAIYVKDEPIDVETVRAMVPLSEAGYIFEIGEAMANLDGPRAFQLIDSQLEVGGQKGKGESPIALMRAAIIPTVRRLLHAKVLMENYGVRATNAGAFANAVAALPDEATAFLPRKKDGKVSAYGIGMVAQQSTKFELSGLVKALEECLEADRSLVTTQLDHRLVLHRLVGRLLASAKPRRKRA